MLGNLTTSLKQAVFDTLSFCVNKYPEKNIIIVADPRAGSTWLSEIILHQSNTALIWEPLHIGENTLFKDIGFGYRQHIPEDHDWPEAKGAFNKVFTGKNLNSWTTKFTSVQKVFSADRLLVKFCRAGLLLPWLVKNFKFERKPVFMVRHPFAVLSSQLKSGSWDKVPDAFEIDESAHNYLFKNHSDYLSTIRTREEVLLCTWCITNGYLLNHPGNNVDWVTLSYEELLLNPKKELSRLYCDHWGVDLPGAVLEEVHRPSRTAFKPDSIYDKDQQLKRWADFFARDQIKIFLNVLDQFNIQLYNEAFLPTRSAHSL